MAKRKKRVKKRKRKIFNFLKKELTEEEQVVKKIREDVRKEKKNREKQELPKKIKERWDKFVTGKRLEREIKKKEREYDKERRKRILPDNGFGD